MKTGRRKFGRTLTGVFIVLAVAFSAMGCSKKSPAVESPAVESPAVESPAVESPAVESPAVESPAPANGITAAMIVDAMGTKAQKQFCAGYAALGDEQAALAAFMKGYNQTTSPSGEEVFAELVSRC